MSNRFPTLSSSYTLNPKPQTPNPKHAKTRDSLEEANRLGGAVISGDGSAERTELLAALLDVFSALKGTNQPQSSPSAWATPASLVADPERSRKALAAIFDVHGRSQVCNSPQLSPFCRLFNRGTLEIP
jgi:hypothetical protein